MRVRLSFLAVLLAAVGGCASAHDAYVDGMEHETTGDYAAAADAYATALERDRALPNVAGRLRVAGREAVRQWLAQAAAAGPVAAGRHYLSAEALIDRAARVGVDVERPATFEADRDAALAGAVAHLQRDAGDRLAAGDFAAALSAASQARAFRPTPDAADALDALAIDTYAAWAEAELAAGRFRAAVRRADEALALGPDAALADALDALRLDALDAGTVVVAVLPVEGGDGLSERARYDLYDVVAEDLLPVADPFVAVVDPVEVRRWDRRQRRAVALADSPRRLAEAAQDLGADLGAVLALGPVREEETAGPARSRTADVEGSSARATYTVREVTLALTATADAVVADAATERSVCDRPVRERVAVAYDDASYDGDWRRLDLSRGERAAFAADRADRARADAEARLRDALAAALATEVAACAGGLVD